jgi:hypothetical protein
MLPVIDAAALAELKRARTLVEHHPRDGRIDATIGDEAFVVAHIDVALGDTVRIDVELCTEQGHPFLRTHEAPFSPSGIILVCDAHVARAAGTLRVRVRDERDVVRTEVVIANQP